MTPQAWAKVTEKMLGMAGDEFGNHGCNDFNLDEAGLTRDEQITLVTFMNERNRSPEETPHDIKRLPWTSDFCVMFACAAYWRRFAEGPTPSERPDGGDGA